MDRLSPGQRPAESDDGTGAVLFDGDMEQAMEMLLAVAAVLEVDLDPNALLPPGEDEDEDEGYGGESLEHDAPGDEDAEGDEPEEPELDPARMDRGLSVLTALANSRTELAELLLRRVVEGEAGVPDGTLRAAVERAETAVADGAEELGVEREEVVARHRDAALDRVAIRLNEMGLERFDVAFHLGHHASGRLAGVWEQVPPAAASLRLLERLYERVEISIGADPLLSLEREASHWQFMQWSPMRRGEEFQFTQGVREQEWSLVERPALGTGGVSVIAAFCEQPFFDVLPPRQQALARALRRSFTGVFVVRPGENGEKLFESVPAGRRYRVFEHNPEAGYSPGSVAVGRLIPWEEGLHLRSPGMVILSAPDPDLAVRFAEALRKAEKADMPPALAQEALISAMLMGEKVPLRLKPAESRAEARDLAQRMIRLLEEYGLAEERNVDDAEDVPEDLRALAAERPDVKLMTYDVDQTVNEWLGELQKMAAGGGSPSGSGKAKGKKAKKGKKKRR